MTENHADMIYIIAAGLKLGVKNVDIWGILTLTWPKISPSTGIVTAVKFLPLFITSIDSD